MGMKKQYCGLDVLKFAMALLVAARHMIQVFFAAESGWRLYVGAWLSNLAVPVFFTAAGFLLFRKAADRPDGSRTVGRYCVRILKLYVLWCVIYWPIDLYNWLHGSESVGEALVYYCRSFFFSSTIAQLWYLPALLVACLIVWFLYLPFHRLWPVAAVTALLFIMGCVGDNWYFTAMLPQKLQQLVYRYGQVFMTMRNGVFYGSFYVALGLVLARKSWRLPPLLSGMGSVFFIGLMYQEVKRCGNINMVFSAAPAAYCLMELALSARIRPRPLYVRLRMMSEWIYLSHFYFFYLFSWTAPFNPLPLTEFRIAWMIFLPMIAFAAWMTWLGERHPWVGKLI